jgi:hypothetical protein
MPMFVDLAEEYMAMGTALGGGGSGLGPPLARSASGALATGANRFRSMASGLTVRAWPKLVLDC